MKKILTRSDNKIIWGVCAGTAEYMDIDVTVVRLITIIVFIFSGFFPVGVIYLIAYLLMPAHDHHNAHHYTQRSKDNTDENDSESDKNKQD